MLSETGKNSEYNKAVNDACESIFEKTPEILLKTGGKGKLLEMGRKEVQNVYKFKKGYSQANTSMNKSPHFKKWDAITRSERIQELEDDQRGICQDLTIIQWSAKCQIRV